MLIFCDFIQFFVFTTNHHRNRVGHIEVFAFRAKLVNTSIGCPNLHMVAMETGV